MENLNNYFEDIIRLDQRLIEIDQRSKKLDTSSDIIENRKHEIFNRVNNLEFNAVLSEKLKALGNQLMIQVDKRKILFDKWKKLSIQQDELNKYAEFIEKMSVENHQSQFTDKQRNQIELMLSQSETIAEKKLELLTERAEILAEEERICNEITKSLAIIK